MSHHSSNCKGDCIYPSSAEQEQPPFFSVAPRTIPTCTFHLCSAGGTPLDVDMYSTHQASAEPAIDSLCAAAWGEEYFSRSFLAF